MSGANQKSLPVYNDTRRRLKWLKNRNLLDRKSYDQVINELLDAKGVPSEEEITAAENSQWPHGDSYNGSQGETGDDSMAGD